MPQVLDSITTSKNGIVINLGLLHFKQAWDIQKKLHERRVSGKVPDTLLLLEHNPVITLGRSGREENILVSKALLQQKGVEFWRVERGGDITFHGPGQLVGYPIFLLQERLAGVRKFVEKIERVLIQTLQEFNVKATAKPRYIGVWVDNKKIAAIGVAVKHWVTYHGFALNVNTDLSYFKFIVPCGIREAEVTSMEQLSGHQIPMTDLREKVIANFGKVFEIEFREEKSIDFV